MNEGKKRIILMILPIAMFALSVSNIGMKKMRKDMEKTSIEQQKSREAHSKAEKQMQQGMDIVDKALENSDTERASIDGNTYKNPYFDVVFTAPEGLELSGQADIEVTLYDEKNGRGVQISVETVPENTSSEMALEAYKKVIRQTMESQSNSENDYKISENGTCTLAEAECAYFDYEMVYQGNGGFLSRQLLRVKGTKAILITIYGSNENEIKELMKCFTAG
ncbi:MAG: hypothetical protein K6G85_03555 [Eubacterium sp.]|nr:hypothetical protein [Eubacterium sp.]